MDDASNIRESTWSSQGNPQTSIPRIKGDKRTHNFTGNERGNQCVAAAAFALLIFSLAQIRLAARFPSQQQNTFITKFESVFIKKRVRFLFAYRVARKPWIWMGGTLGLFVYSFDWCTCILGLPENTCWLGLELASFAADDREGVGDELTDGWRKKKEGGSNSLSFVSFPYRPVGSFSLLFRFLPSDKRSRVVRSWLPANSYSVHTSVYSITKKSEESNPPF